MTTNIAYLDESTAAGWERTLYVFLGGEGAPLLLLADCPELVAHASRPFGRTAKTPDEVTSAYVFAWSYSRGHAGREPSSITIGARLAASAPSTGSSSE